MALPPHVHRVVSRGREYFAFHPFRGTKRAGERVKLPGTPQLVDGSPDPAWWAEYRRLAGEPAPSTRAGTFARLIAEYQASPEWAALVASTRSDWTRYLAHVDAAWGETMVRGLAPKHVLKLRDAFADMPPAPPAKLVKPIEDYVQRPAAANNLLRSLSAMITWAVPRGWRDDNPCLLVPKFEGGEGYAPWSWEEIELHRRVAAQRFVDAAALALYTGQRLGDVLALGKHQVDGNLIGVRQEKTDKLLWIAIHRDLRPTVIRLVREAAKRAEAGVVSLTLLVTSDGTPWTKDGFKASWQAHMQAAELAALRERRRVFHGLRKSAVVMLLEAGCSDGEVAAITGQSRQMIEHYSKQVNQKRMAAAAILKWEAAEALRLNEAGT